MARRTAKGRSDPKAAKRAYDQQRIIELWLARPRHQRTSDDLMKFYGWLSEHQPDLLPASAPGAGTYQQLRTLLGAHIQDA